MKESAACKLLLLCLQVSRAVWEEVCGLVGKRADIPASLLGAMPLGAPLTKARTMAEGLAKGMKLSSGSL